jgi:hypothetical protein
MHETRERERARLAAKAGLPGRAAAARQHRGSCARFPGRALATVFADRVAAWDEDQEHTLGVLVLDEPGCGGAPLRFHKASTVPIVRWWAPVFRP